MNVVTMVFATKENVNVIPALPMLIVACNTALKIVMDMEVALITRVAYVNLVLKVLVVKLNNAQ